MYIADHDFVNPKYIFTSWLLVGVGHHASDKVWLSLVEGAHQVVQLTLEVGGDGLAALPLLPVLVFWRFEGLTWMVGKALDRKRVGSILDHLHLGG